MEILKPSVLELKSGNNPASQIFYIEFFKDL